MSRTEAEKMAQKNYYLKHKKEIYKKKYERIKQLLKWGREHERNCLNYKK